MELRRRLCLTSKSALLVQRRLRWFSHAARRLNQGPSFSHTASYVAQTSWRPAEDMGNHDQGRPGTALRTASLRWRKDWVKVFNELAQDRRAVSASVRDVVNSIGDASLTHPGRMPTHVRVSKLLVLMAASPIGLTTSQVEGLQSRQSFLHHARPKACGPGRGSRSSLSVVARIFSWLLVRFRHE